MPPAAANALFPEQANIPSPVEADLNASVVFPQLFAALSEAHVGESSPEDAAGMSTVASEMAPFSALPRPALMAGRHDGVGRLAKANDEQNDVAVCAAQSILPWTACSREMMPGFGSPLRLSFPSTEPERGEAAVTEDSPVPGSQFVSLPVGFSPIEPLLEKPPVSADALAESVAIGDEPLEGHEPQGPAAMSTLLAAESENAIPIWDRSERIVTDEPPPEVPRQESITLFPTLPGAAANQNNGTPPGQDFLSPSLQGAAFGDDARGRVLDGRQPVPAMPKVQLSDAPGPLTREAFRLLLRENTAFPAESRTAAVPVTPLPLGPAFPSGPSEQAAEEDVPLRQIFSLQEGAVEVRPARNHTPFRAQQPIPDTAPLSKTSIPVVEPAASGVDEATGKGIEISAAFAQGGSAHNGHTKNPEQANGMEQPDASGKTGLSREHLALPVNLRPTVEPFSVKQVSEAAAPASPREEPVGTHAVPNPVRQLRVSLQSSEAGGGVQLLVQQRPGGVEVSVHSPNPSVRETLRSGLSELIGSLDRKGVLTETLPSVSALSGGLAERVDSTGPSMITEVPEGEGREDHRGRQERSPQWESGGDNRRRQNPDADAWKKYLEEYAWRNQ